MSTPVDHKHPDTRRFSTGIYDSPHRMVEFRGGALSGTHMLNTCYSGYLEQWCRNGNEVYRLHYESLQEHPGIHLFYQFEGKEKEI